jgi:hypothetical protein
MAGLVPAIHAVMPQMALQFLALFVDRLKRQMFLILPGELRPHVAPKLVDGRDKPGHDGYPLPGNLLRLQRVERSY